MRIFFSLLCAFTAGNASTHGYGSACLMFVMLAGALAIWAARDP